MQLTLSVQHCRVHQHTHGLRVSNLFAVHAIGVCSLHRALELQAECMDRPHGQGCSLLYECLMALGYEFSNL